MVPFVYLDFSAVPDNKSDIRNEHLYTGRRRDPETGLQLNRNRFYASHLGRWVNRDPIGYEGGGNLYGYVGNRPIYYEDPTGKSWWAIIPIFLTFIECAFDPPGGHIRDYGAASVSCEDCQQNLEVAEKNCQDEVFDLTTQYLNSYLELGLITGPLEAVIGVGVGVFTGHPVFAGVITIDGAIRSMCILNNVLDIGEAARAASNRNCRCPKNR